MAGDGGILSLKVFLEETSRVRFPAGHTKPLVRFARISFVGQNSLAEEPNSLPTICMVPKHIVARFHFSSPV